MPHSLDRLWGDRGVQMGHGKNEALLGETVVELTDFLKMTLLVRPSQLKVPG